jgi:FkbM family methyltransferase
MSLRSSLRKLRRAAYEFAGNGRYSRPALNDLDSKLSRYLTGRDGVFIEAGANDGFSQSNTYYLEKVLGWSGILVEAIPSLYEQARRCRSRARVFNCALVPFAHEGAEIKLTYGNLMSLVDGAMGSPEADAEHIREARRHDQEAGSFQVKVRGRALSSLIDECGLTRVDFLSLDVEGYEEQVLRGIDFARHRPTLICVEARHRSAVEQVLLPYYTLVQQLTEMDVLYRARS